MDRQALDAATARFYDGYAAQLTTTEAARSAMLPHAIQALPPGASVLDVGAGSGRDMAALQELGFDVFGVEPNAAMRATALRLRPGLAGRLRDAALPALGRPFADQRPQGFDALLCSAVLMHITPDDLATALAALAQQLRPAAPGDTGAQRAALLLSLPEMGRPWLHGDRDADDRHFHNHHPDTVRALLAPLGLQLADALTQEQMRASTGTCWHTLLFRRG